jgi:hypothetical protein
MPPDESDLTGRARTVQTPLVKESKFAHTRGGDLVSGAEKSITSAIYERIRSVLFIQTTQTIHTSTDLSESWEKQEAPDKGEV